MKNTKRYACGNEKCNMLCPMIGKFICCKDCGEKEEGCGCMYLEEVEEEDD